MHDVLIVGARCAGSALALRLANAGLKVLLIDRARFPSDTMSGHYIHPTGVACLRRMGLYDAVARLGAPVQRAVTVDFGPVALRAVPAPAPDGTVEGIAPRRYRFDAMLAAAAVDAGAELREGVSFLAPGDRRRPSGRRPPHHASGGEETVQARLVVGADGKRSRLARAVGAEAYDHQPGDDVHLLHLLERDFDAPETRLFVRDGRFFVAAPTNDGLTFLAVAWPAADFRSGARRHRGRLPRGSRGGPLDRRAARRRAAGGAVRRHRRSRRLPAGAARAWLGAGRGRRATTRTRSPPRA